MKCRIVAGAAALALGATALVGCSSGSESGDASGSSGSSEAGSGTRIALVMSHMSNSFTTTVANAAKEEGDKLGVDVTVFDGKKDVNTQINQIQSAVSQGYDGILVEPVSQEGINPALKIANDAGVPIVTLIQQATDQDKAAAYAGGDDKAAGVLQMKESLAAIGNKGSIAIIYGPMGSDGQLQRKAGYDEVLAENPDVTVAFEQTANWDTAEALTLTENWLSTGTPIDAIVSQNDSMAIGALKALTDSGKDADVKVFGVDATDDGVASIKAGGLDGTVSQDTPGMGRLGVDVLLKVINGEEVDPLNFTQAVWITKENVDTLSQN